MKISIGMLAYNEALRIAGTIRSVFAQSLLRDPPAHVAAIELVVVPNGCKDDTADVSRRAIGEELAKLPDALRPRVSGRVEELAQAGKSNAWNEFVHRISDQQADALLMLDSDIAFNHEQCFRLLLDKLQATPSAWCAVGRPLKDVAFKREKSLADRLSLMASSSSATGPATIAGSMYLIRGDVVRRIWMPVGLLTEDGFLRAMLITEFFTNPGENPDRIVREERASQIFEAVKSPSGVFKHARRLLVGARINACVYDMLWNLPKAPDGLPLEDAGAWSKRQHQQNPQWLQALVRERIGGKGWWVMQPGLILDRFHRVLKKPMPKKLAHLPVAAGLFPFDLAVLLSANRAVRRGEFRW